MNYLSEVKIWSLYVSGKYGLIEKTPGDRVFKKEMVACIL